jgi:hypothetical protein
MDKLIQGKRYHIPFIAPYTSKGPYDVEISGVTKKVELPIYGDFDIRGTFFDEVGIKTYLTMVTEDTDIYICHPITSYDPLEVDTGSFVFIPASIVDYSNIDEYLPVTRFRFEIEGIRRHFDTSYENNQFVEELNESIPAAIMEGTNLANDILSLTNTQDELLILKSVVDKEEADRESYIKIRENNKLAMKKAEIDREMDYLRRMKELEQRESIITQKEAVIDRNVKQSEESKVIGNAFLQMTNDYLARIKIMYDTIISRSVGINLPSWDELLAILTINQDPNDLEITLQEWKAGFESYSRGGTFPESWKNLETAECPYCKRIKEDIRSSEESKKKNNG